MGALPGIGRGYDRRELPVKLVALRGPERPRTRYVSIAKAMEMTGHGCADSLRRWLNRWNGQHAGDPEMQIRRLAGRVEVNDLEAALAWMAREAGAGSRRPDRRKTSTAVGAENAEVGGEVSHG